MGDLQAYLKKRYGAAQRYGAANDSKQLKPKKKKKADKKPPPACEGVKIVDDDVVWHRQTQEESESEGEEEAPAVVENLEVTRMMKMEELRHRPYLAIGDDGSGWVDVTQGQDPPKKTVQKDDSPGLSPPQERARHDTPDLSPPRRSGRHDSPEKRASSDLSPPRGRHDSPDLSSPRQRRGRQASPDQSPASKRGRRDSPDLSPPRQRRGRQASPVRKRDSPDLSPPRQRREKQASPDLSPPRPRQRKGRQASPDQSPALQKGRDLSPPRRGVRHDSPDLSPPRPRRGRHDSPDLSPARQRLRHDSPDPSPARQRARHDSPDLSPPREGRRGRRDSPDISPPRKQDVSRRNSSPPPKKKTALRTGAELMDEINQQKLQEAKRIKELDASVTGRGAETVYRDKHGRRLEGLEELMKQQQGRAKPAEQPLEWGTGLAQKRKFEKSQQELEEEKNKPFARSKDDPDLDKLLKNRIRWGDPMAHLVKNDDMLLEDFGKSETLKESGFIVPQEIPAHSWLKRGHPAAPNRYQIRPGRHWDGVDRSNGFEADLFKHQNEKKANQDEAYRWSVADM